MANSSLKEMNYAKLYIMVRLPLLPGSPVRVASMGQIDMFENY